MPEAEVERRAVALRLARSVGSPRRAHVIDAVTKGTSPLTSDAAHAKAFAVTAVELDTSRKFAAVKADLEHWRKPSGRQCTPTKRGRRLGK